jgi:hypothetical protein
MENQPSVCHRNETNLDSLLLTAGSEVFLYARRAKTTAQPFLNEEVSTAGVDQPIFFLAKQPTPETGTY